jgi:ubiquinol-cytochrome c reductase iron-sulfur subunit
MERPNTTSIPDFSDYRAGSEGTNKTMQYFMVGSLGVLAASGAKSTVADVLSNMAASADVLALAKIEVEMGAIPEGASCAFLKDACPSRSEKGMPGEAKRGAETDAATRDPCVRVVWRNARVALI